MNPIRYSGNSRSSRNSSSLSNSDYNSSISQKLQDISSRISDLDPDDPNYNYYLSLCAEDVQGVVQEHLNSDAGRYIPEVTRQQISNVLYMLENIPHASDDRIAVFIECLQSLKNHLYSQ